MWRRHRVTSDPSDADTREATLRLEFTAACARVETARHGFQSMIGRRHSSVDARAAARVLTTALQEATAIAASALQQLPPRPEDRHRSPSRRRVRRPPSNERWWSSQLVHLAEVSQWLRRTVLDDLGLNVPSGVQVGSRAATGPHIAGLDADPPDLVAATLHKPWIGVPLIDIIDRVTTSEQALSEPPPP